MKVRRLGDCREITALDGCRLRELLHPDRGAPELGWSLAVAVVEPGQAMHPHRLLGETEVYWIVSGRGRMHVGDDVATVEPGDAVVIPAGAVQWIACFGPEPLRFVAIVEPAWRADHDVRVDGP